MVVLEGDIFSYERGISVVPGPSEGASDVQEYLARRKTSAPMTLQ